MSKLSSRGAAWDKTRLKVLDRDAWRCGYCGVDLVSTTGSKNSATVEHILAKANGGTDAMDNLMACCLECNGRKSDKLLVRQNWINRNWLDKL